MKTLKGLGVSPGIAIGRVVVWNKISVSLPRYHIESGQVANEVRRFEEALYRAEKEILSLKRKVEKNAGKKPAEIFTVHQALLRDRFLRENTLRLIREELINCESALERVVEDLATLFQETPDDLLQDRRRDLMDVLERLTKNLKGLPADQRLEAGASVIVAPDLSPSQVAALDRKLVIGFATDMGSRTSHAAILARALEIPAVMGLGKVTKLARDGQLMLIGGEEGTVVIDPAPAVVRKYRKKKREFLRTKEQQYRLCRLPPRTRDGWHLKLYANIEFPEEARGARKYGVEGIGLYRTEYLYLNRKDLPSEEEQFQAYKTVARLMRDKPVVIRTLDIGGDKFASRFNFPPELNPFLGWRAIRFCLERKDLFEVQLKAILRAACHGHLKILLPLISTLEEVRQTKDFLKTVQQKLRREKKSFRDRVEIGLMMEVPSAVLIADILAEEVDFFSIGTNDLIQYTMAVDRINDKITHLYQPCHPAVLKLIRSVVESGHRNNLKVSLCGEMAASPELACLLLGMEIDELSMAAAAIPAVKAAIREVHGARMKEAARHVLGLRTNDEVQRYLQRILDSERRRPVVPTERGR